MTDRTVTGNNELKVNKIPIAVSQVHVPDRKQSSDRRHSSCDQLYKFGGFLFPLNNAIPGVFHLV